MGKPTHSEAYYAAAVVEFLRGEQQWTVYQEVAMSSMREGGESVDIVATRNDQVWAIEVKTSFSWVVVGQAMRWRRFANFVSVAVPRTLWPNKWAVDAQTECMHALGIGVLTVSAGEHLAPWVNQDLPAPLNPKARTVEILDRLHADQIDSVAGSPSGGAITPFRRTCNRLLEYVEATGPTRLLDAMKAIDHHYSGGDSEARYNMASCIRRGIVPGVRLDGGIVSVRVET